MKSDKALNHASAVLGLSFVVLVSMALNYYFEPQRPVMQFLMPASSWSFKGGIAQISLYGHKVRECPLVSGSEKAKAVISGELVEKGVYFQWYKDPSPGDSFPAGYVSPVAARWATELMSRANKLGLELTHDCDGKKIVSYYWYDLPLLEDREIGEL